MTERREPDRPGIRRGPCSASPEQSSQSPVLDLQRSAGNKAMAELLARQARPDEPASPGIRIRDALRAGRPPVQREFGLTVQRIDKGDLKQPGRLLTVGTRGSDVATVQQLLGIDADGIFGPNTRARVIEFQAASGLTADGIVGPMTFSALVSATDKIPSSTDKLASDSTEKLDQFKSG